MRMRPGLDAKVLLLVFVAGFFSGIGGFELGFEREGFKVISVCEIDPYCSKVLKRHWPKVPNLGDIKPLSTASRAKTYRLREKAKALVARGVDSGVTISMSFALSLLTGSLQKTSVTLGDDGCPNCGELFTKLGMPLCHYECEPLTWEPPISVAASSLLPTPTASSYGSCRGGGLGRVGKWRKSLESLGIGHPQVREIMMGFPIGWTEIERLEMQSFRKSRKSSREVSKKSANKKGAGS